MNYEIILHKLQSIDVVENMKNNMTNFLKENNLSRQTFCELLIKTSAEKYHKEVNYSENVLKNLFNKKRDRNLKLLDIDLFCKVMNITPDELLFNAKPHEIFAYTSFPLSDKAYNNIIKLLYKSFDLIIHDYEDNSISNNFISSIINSVVNSVRTTHSFLLNLKTTNSITKYNNKMNAEVLNQFNLTNDDILTYLEKLNEQNTDTMIKTIIENFIVIHSDYCYLDTNFCSFETIYHDFKQYDNFDIHNLTFGDQLFMKNKEDIIKKLNMSSSKYNRMCDINSKRNLPRTQKYAYWNEDCNPGINDLLKLMSYYSISLTELMYKDKLHKKFEYIPSICIEQMFSNFFPDNLYNEQVDMFLQHKRLPRFINNLVVLNVLNIIIYNICTHIDIDLSDYDDRTFNLINDESTIDDIDDVLYANYLLNNFKINEEKYMDDFKIFSIKKIYLNTYSRCERDIIRIIEDIYHIEL